MLDAHLRRLESESIEIFREVFAECRAPVILYSIGKDSTVLLHLARKACFPAPLRLPVLHVDTGWKFREMIAFRDLVAAQLGLNLIVHTNEAGRARDISPFDGGGAEHTRVMKTEALRQALDLHGFDAAIGGARRDEEASRAKERVFSVRGPGHAWDPKRQRPEFWRLHNARLGPGETMRVFPLSDWTEVDVWRYIAAERLDVVPLYFAQLRPMVERDGVLIEAHDSRMRLYSGEQPVMRRVRYRSLGCYPLSGAVLSDADTLDALIAETATATMSERGGRLIDRDPAEGMERKKREGYF